MSKIILLITLFFLQINIVYSEVYKWIGEDGKTIYSDKTTSNNAEKIKIKKSSKQDKQYQQRYKKQQKLLNVMQEEREEKIALKKEAQEKKRKQKIKCAGIIKELQEMKDAGLFYEKTEDPYNPKIYTDEERKAEEEKYAKYIKENCR